MLVVVCWYTKWTFLAQPLIRLEYGIFVKPLFKRVFGAIYATRITNSLSDALLALEMCLLFVPNI